MSQCSSPKVSKLERIETEREEIREEASQRTLHRHNEKQRKFWFEAPEVTAYLLKNSTLSHLKAPIYLPRSVFLLRLLRPISSTGYDAGLVCRQRLRELDALQTPLDPTDPRASAIMQDLRSALKHPQGSVIMGRLKSEDERESSLDVDAEENKYLEAASLRSLVVRCTGVLLDIPAKEEALFFLAAVAMNNQDAFPFSGTLVLEQVLQAVAGCFSSLDRYYTEKRKAREAYELLKIHAKFSEEKIYVPPTFPQRRYRHEGNWACHRMRSLSLYAAAVMMHHWKRPELVETLINNCRQHRLFTRLMLLRLLHTVLRNWSAHDRHFSDMTHRLMKRLWETRADDGEFKESQDLIVFCFQRIRSVMGRTSAVMTYPFHILQALGQRKSSTAKPKKTVLSSTSSFSGKHPPKVKKIPPQTLPPIS